MKIDVKGELIEVVEILAGTFWMGSPDDELGREEDESLHQVMLTKNFLMMAFPVTQGQFERFMGYNPSGYDDCDKNCPVDWVNWHEALAFCNALSRAQKLPECFDLSGAQENVRAKIKPRYAGQKYTQCSGWRLPTEAEWEYAYRAGSQTAFYHGDLEELAGFSPQLDRIAWYEANSEETLHPVGMKNPNKWGLYDMAGLLWEWTFDSWKSDLGRSPVVDPIVFDETDERVAKGGSIENEAIYCRAAYRSCNDSHDRLLMGFRPVKTISSMRKSSLSS